MALLSQREKAVLYDRYSCSGMQRLKQLSDGCIKHYGNIQNSEYDDFYSQANECLWRCIEKYDTDKNNSFEALLVFEMSNKFKTMLTKKNTKKRGGRGFGSDEYNKMNEDENYTMVHVPFDMSVDESGHTLCDIISDGFDLEQFVIQQEHDMLEEFSKKTINYLNHLSPKQRKIALAIANGKNEAEICKEFKLNPKSFNECMKKLKLYDKVQYLI